MTLPPPLYGLAAVEWPLVVCQELAFGTTAFFFAIAPEQADSSRLPVALRRLWIVLAVGALVVSPVAMLADVGQMAGVPIRHAFVLVPEAVAATHVGRMWVWRIAAAAILVMLAWLCRPSRCSAVWLFAVATCMLLMSALSSHAIDAGALAITVYFIHESAAGLWLGAIVGLAVLLWLRCEAPWTSDAAKRVSTVAAWSVVALAASGVYMAYHALGLDVGRLVYSSYGQIVLVKIAIFGATLAFGAYNRLRLIPASEKVQARRVLLRTIAAESVLIVGAMAAASLLANTAPG